MARAPAAISEDRIVDAFYAVAAAQGWQAVAIESVAQEAGVPAAKVAERYADRVALATAAVDLADRRMLKDIIAADEAEPTRDRLFDLVMRRIDAQSTHRDGVAAIARGLPFDPVAAGWFLCLLHRSMTRLLEAGGVSTRGLRGELRVQGMLAVWNSVLRAWLKDETPDLAKTMKALDKALDRAEQMELMTLTCVPFLRRRGGRGDEAVAPTDATPPGGGI